MSNFLQFVFTPAGLADAALAIAATRAGAVGVYNAELDASPAAAEAAVAKLTALARGPFGLRLERIDASLVPVLQIGRAHV